MHENLGSEKRQFLSPQLYGGSAGVVTYDDYYRDGLEREIRHYDEVTNQNLGPNQFEYYLADHPWRVLRVGLQVLDCLGIQPRHNSYNPYRIAAINHDRSKRRKKYSDLWRIDGNLEPAQRRFMRVHSRDSARELLADADACPYESLANDMRIAVRPVAGHHKFWRIREPRLAVLGAVILYPDWLVGAMEYRGESHPGWHQFAAVAYIQANAFLKVPQRYGPKFNGLVKEIVDSIVWLYGPQSNGIPRHWIDLGRNAPRTPPAVLPPQ